MDLLFYGVGKRLVNRCTAGRRWSIYSIGYSFTLGIGGELGWLTTGGRRGGRPSSLWWMSGWEGKTILGTILCFTGFD